ncbi:hypothetical protein P7K49_010136 [Saguinus oedipus]|uniref:Uncharacterized protein n=1 Tax=Saguinus oedipus TaxID=9490 RepID=A0ABQ9VLX6_SAGOE|nr:hypothetical protein P7K49_010136 [Saguinus oedipus]
MATPHQLPDPPCLLHAIVFTHPILHLSGPPDLMLGGLPNLQLRLAPFGEPFGLQMNSPSTTAEACVSGWAGSMDVSSVLTNDGNQL